MAESITTSRVIAQIYAIMTNVTGAADIVKYAREQESLLPLEASKAQIIEAADSFLLEMRKVLEQIWEFSLYADPLLPDILNADSSAEPEQQLKRVHDNYKLQQQRKMENSKAVSELPYAGQVAVSVFESLRSFGQQMVFVQKPLQVSLEDLPEDMQSWLKKAIDTLTLRKVVYEAAAQARDKLVQRLEDENLLLPEWYELSWELFVDPMRPDSNGYYYDAGYTVAHNFKIYDLILSGRLAYKGIAGDGSGVMYEFKGRSYTIPPEVMKDALRQHERAESAEWAHNNLPPELQEIFVFLNRGNVASGPQNRVFSAANYFAQDTSLMLSVASLRPKPKTFDGWERMLAASPADKMSRYHYVKTAFEEMNFEDMQVLLELPHVIPGQKAYLTEGQREKLAGYIKRLGQKQVNYDNNACALYARIMLVEMLRMQETYLAVSGNVAAANIGQSENLLQPQDLFDFAQKAALREMEEYATQMRAFAQKQRA